MAAEQAGRPAPERDDARARERGEVDDRDRIVLGLRVMERVGEHDAALGVGIEHLDRLARRRGDDVAGPIGVAARAGSRRRRSRRPRGSAARAARTRAATPITVAAPDMSCFISSMPCGGLDRDAARVERDALAHDARTARDVLRRALAARTRARSGAAGARCRRPPRGSRPSCAARARERRTRATAGPPRAPPCAPPAASCSGESTLGGRFESSRAMFCDSAITHAAARGLAARAQVLAARHEQRDGGRRATPRRSSRDRRRSDSRRAPRPPRAPGTIPDRRPRRAAAPPARRASRARRPRGTPRPRRRAQRLGVDRLRLAHPPAAARASPCGADPDTRAACWPALPVKSPDRDGGRDHAARARDRSPRAAARAAIGAARRSRSAPRADPPGLRRARARSTVTFITPLLVCGCGRGPLPRLAPPIQRSES